MAASMIPTSAKLVLKCNVGIDGQGKDIFKNVTFSKIKPNATAQQLLDFGVPAGELIDSMNYELNYNLTYQIIG